MPRGQQIGATAGSVGGAALGNVLLPGIGGYIGSGLGGIIGGGLGGLFDGGSDTPSPEEQRRRQLQALSQRLMGEASKDPYQTAGYRARIGEARDAVREDSQADAARAVTLGLSPGLATAAGAGERARALASTERAAVGDAEANQARLQALSANLLGQTIQMDEAEAERRRAARNGQFGAIAGLAGTALTGYLDYQNQRRGNIKPIA